MFITDAEIEELIQDPDHEDKERLKALEQDLSPEDPFAALLAERLDEERWELSIGTREG